MNYFISFCVKDLVKSWKGDTMATVNFSPKDLSAIHTMTADTALINFDLPGRPISIQTKGK